MRSAVKRRQDAYEHQSCEKAGIDVYEYKILEKRNAALEVEFNRITDEWLEGKKSSMLKFTMGTLGLDDPMDRRYFYAVDESGSMVAYIVLCLSLERTDIWQI